MTPSMPQSAAPSKTPWALLRPVARAAAALTVAAGLATACLDAPENFYGFDLNAVTFVLESEDMGIHPSRDVMAAVSNPFRDADPGAEMKWELLSYGGSAAAFYAWATRLANEPTGEHQYYTATTLQRLYDNDEVPSVVRPTVRDMALRAYGAVLEHFPDSITFDATGQFPYRLAPLAYDAILGMGGAPPPGWVKVETADGGTSVVQVPERVPDPIEED